MNSDGTEMGGGQANERGIITGVSLPSFLQVLELEKNSCVVYVKSGDNKGMLYVKDGDLIDAETDFNVGLEAVYSICSWSKPALRVDKYFDRVRRIHKPLTHILLDIARKKEETKSPEPSSSQPQSEPTQTSQGPADPAMAAEPAESAPLADVPADVLHKYPIVDKCLKLLPSVPGLRHYFFLNRHGRVIIQSAENRKIADFITYSIITGLQMGTILEAKGPQIVLLTMENYEELLIMPRSGVIIGLLLEEDIYVPDVINQLQAAFKS